MAISPQNVTLEASHLLNSPVSDLEDGTVQELLAAERCTAEADKKDYVMAADLRPNSLYLSFSPLRMLSSPREHSYISWHSSGGTMQLNGFSKMELSLTLKIT